MSLNLEAVVSLNRESFDSALGGMQQIVSDAAGAMAYAFGGVTGELYTMAAAFGPIGLGVAILKEATEAGTELQTAMLKVASVTGDAGSGMAVLTQQAIAMSQQTTFSAGEVATAMYGIASAGYTAGQDITNVLDPALKLAVATQSDVTTATETLTGAMNAFRLSTSDTTDVANLFLGAINASPATMERLNESVANAAPTANAFGMTLDQMIESLAAFEKVGIAGSEAGTAFKQAMINLNEEMVKNNSVVGEALQGWNPAIEGLTGAIKRLEEAGVTGTDIMTELGVRGGSAVSAQLALGSAAITQLGRDIESTGDVTKSFNTQMSGVEQQWALFINMMKADGIAIWDNLSGAMMSTVNVLQDVAKYIGTVISAFSSGGLSAALGKMASDFADVWPQIQQSTVNGVATAVSGLQSLTDKVKAINWVGIDTAIINGIKGQLDKTWPTFPPLISAGWALFTESLKGLAHAIDIIDWTSVGAAIYSKIEPELTKAFDKIKLAIDYGKNQFSAVWAATKDVFGTIDWSSVFADVYAKAKTAFEWLTSNIKKLIKAYEATSDAVWGGIANMVKSIDWATAVNATGSAMGTSFDFLRGQIMKHGVAVSAAVASMADTITNALGDIEFGKAGQTIAQKLLAVLGDAADIVKSNATGATAETIGAAVAAVIRAGLGFAINILSDEGLLSIANALYGLLQGSANMLSGFTAGLFDGLFGVNFGEIFAGSIDAAGWRILSATDHVIALFLSGISGAVKDMMSIVQSGLDFLADLSVVPGMGALASGAQHASDSIKNLDFGAGFEANATLNEERARQSEERNAALMTERLQPRATRPTKPDKQMGPPVPTGLNASATQITSIAGVASEIQGRIANALDILVGMKGLLWS